MNGYCVPFGEWMLIDHADDLHLMRADTDEIARRLTLIVNRFNCAFRSDSVLGSRIICRQGDFFRPNDKFDGTFPVQLRGAGFGNAQPAQIRHVQLNFRAIQVQALGGQDV